MSVSLRQEMQDLINAAEGMLDTINILWYAQHRNEWGHADPPLSEEEAEAKHIDAVRTLNRALYYANKAMKDSETTIKVTYGPAVLDDEALAVIYGKETE